MRGAGCTLNDIVDRDFDGQVARTRRPADPERRGHACARRRSSWRLQLAVGAGGAVQPQPRSRSCSASPSLALIATYPFMKRIT